MKLLFYFENFRKMKFKLFFEIFQNKILEFWKFLFWKISKNKFNLILKNEKGGPDPGNGAAGPETLLNKGFGEGPFCAKNAFPTFSSFCKSRFPEFRSPGIRIQNKNMLFHFSTNSKINSFCGNIKTIFILLCKILKNDIAIPDKTWKIMITQL